MQLLGLILGAISLPAAAVPIHATFAGAVSGSSGFFTNVLNDFPAGTVASFDVTFDDSGLLPSAPLSDFDLAPVSGWLRLGGLEWSLDAVSIWIYQYSGSPGNPINYYGLQLTGSGPTIGGGASLFGLFLNLTPDLNPFSSTSLSAGFGYPTGGGEFYSYADLAGTFTASRATTTVPEPDTALLMLPVLALLWRARRARAAIVPTANPTSTARSPA